MLDTVPNLATADRKELLELLELTSKWESQQDSKFYVYSPTDISIPFHSSNAKVRALFGGNRSSKTYSHMMDYAIQFTGEEPEALKGRIPKHRLDQTRRLRFCMGDYPNSFSKVIWPYVQLLIPDHAIVDVVKDSGRIKSIVNSKGGFIEFMQYDQDVTKFQGSSRHAIGSDEEPPESIRDENLMRLADTDGEETFSLTPVSGALKYLYDKVYLKRGREVEKLYEFLDKNGRPIDEKTDGELFDVKAGVLRDIIVPGGDPDYHIFFACIFDNPAIKKEAAIRVLKGFPKEELIVRGKGHFLFLSGLVYKEFSQQTHVIPSHSNWRDMHDYTTYIMIDPHPRTPHAVQFGCVRRDGQKEIVAEIFEDCQAHDLAARIKDTLGPVQPEVIICDPLAWTPDPISKRCFAVELMKSLDGMRVSAPFIKSSKDRTNGVLQTRKELAVVDGKVPGILVHDNCTRFIYEITHWAWDNWRKDTSSTKGDKQAPIDKDDHMMENLYRFVLLDPHYVYPKINIPSHGSSSRSRMGASKVTGY